MNAAESDAITAITKVMCAYCRCIDEGRTTDFAEIYAEDGVHDDGRARRAGRDEIQAMAEAVVARYEATSHHVSNIDITLTDSKSAHAHSYVYAWHRRAGAADLEVWGRYEDRFVFRNGRWLIAERKLFVAGLRGLDVDPGFRKAPRA